MEKHNFISKTSLKKLLILFVTIICSHSSHSQETSSENLAIEKSILNYIENFFENEFDAMNKSLHPRLAKRGWNPDGSLSGDAPPEKLKILMSNKKKFELKHQKNIVESIVIYGNMASAVLRTGYPKQRWTEFIHLLKENGEWKLINVFWEFKSATKGNGN